MIGKLRVLTSSRTKDRLDDGWRPTEIGRTDSKSADTSRNVPDYSERYVYPDIGQRGRVCMVQTYPRPLVFSRGRRRIRGVFVT